MGREAEVYKLRQCKQCGVKRNTNAEGMRLHVRMHRSNLYQPEEMQLIVPANSEDIKRIELK